MFEQDAALTRMQLLQKYIVYFVTFVLYMTRLALCDREYWFNGIFILYFVSILPSRNHDVACDVIVKMGASIGSLVVIWRVHGDFAGGVMMFVLLQAYGTLFKCMNYGMFYKRKKLELLGKELHQQNESKLAFMSNVSHEFKSLLQSIKGCVELLHDEQSTVSEQQLDYLQTIDTCSDMMYNFVKEILDFVKLDRQREENLTSPQVCLREAIHRVCSMLKGSLDMKQVTLSLQMHERVPHHAQTISEVRLQQIMINLISNAIKISPAQETVSVEVAMETPDKLRIMIMDNGPGISSEKAESLFTPFKGEGTGLGLCICKQLAQLVGGDVTLQPKSPQCKGASFCIHVPCVETLVLDCQQCLLNSSHMNETTSSNAPLTTTVNDAKIIVADDSPYIRKLLVNALQRRGFNPDTAPNGEQVLCKYDSTPYELVITDLNMPPGMNGIQLATTLKQRNSAIKILLLTGEGEQQVQNCNAVDCILYKPVNMSQLCATVHKLLNCES